MLSDLQSAEHWLQECRVNVDAARAHLHGLLHVGSVAPHKRERYSEAVRKAARAYISAGDAARNAARRVESLRPKQRYTTREPHNTEISASRTTQKLARAAQHRN